MNNQPPEQVFGAAFDSLSDLDHPAQVLDAIRGLIRHLYRIRGAETFSLTTEGGTLALWRYEGYVYIEGIVRTNDSAADLRVKIAENDARVDVDLNVLQGRFVARVAI